MFTFLKSYGPPTGLNLILTKSTILTVYPFSFMAVSAAITKSWLKECYPSGWDVMIRTFFPYILGASFSRLGL